MCVESGRHPPVPRRVPSGRVGLVFTTGVGAPVAPRHDYRDFHRLLEQAGLRRVRLHDLRHTAASLMLGAVSIRGW